VQAFRSAYLFSELKDLLHVWTPLLDAALYDSSLPQDDCIDASNAASATFDISPVGLRFRVPSAGFFLIWTTHPNSPALHLPSPASPTKPSPKRTIYSAVRNHSGTYGTMRSARSDNVLVQLGRPPSTGLSDGVAPVVTGGMRNVRSLSGVVGSMGPPEDVETSRVATGTGQKRLQPDSE
jgi:hypothetical protein